MISINVSEWTFPPFDSDKKRLQEAAVNLFDELPSRKSVKKAIKDGKIVEVSEDNLDKFYNAKEVLNANGKTILPGLIDSHCHFYGLGEDQLVVDL